MPLILKVPEGWDVDQLPPGILICGTVGIVAGLQTALAPYQAGLGAALGVTWSTGVSQLAYLTLPPQSFSALSGAAAASKDLPFVHQAPGAVL